MNSLKGAYIGAYIGLRVYRAQGLGSTIFKGGLYSTLYRV